MKNYMIISIDTEKILDKIHPFKTKGLRNIWQTNSCHPLEWGKIESISTMNWNQTGCSILQLAFNMTLEGLTRAIQEQEIKGAQVEQKEIKLFLFVNEIIPRLVNQKIPLRDYWNSQESLLNV